MCLFLFFQVLTAAHCEIDEQHGRHALIIGSGKLSKKRMYTIVKVYVHEGFHRGMRDEPINDVAVIEFANRDEKLVPYYPQLNTDHSAPSLTSRVFISGFGRTNRAGPSSNILLTVRVPVKESNYCMKQYGGVDMTKNICAGSTSADSCQGDSGSGLWERDPRNRTKFMIMGIVSYGAGCAMFKSPGVYTRVSMYLPWIRDKANAPPTAFPGDTLKQLAMWGAAVGALVIISALIWFTVAQLRRGQKASVHFDEANLERHAPDNLGGF